MTDNDRTANSMDSPRYSGSETGEKQKRMGNYLLGKTLGQGAFSKVKLGQSMKTGEKVAIKIIHKNLITDIEDIERINREVHVLKRINHPNIIRILEVIEDHDQMSIIMEHASGGELFDRIVENGKLEEAECRRIFNQICSAVEYCHRQKIVHRDLKPENILFDANNNVKLVDFGLSNTIRHGFLLKTMCGSPAYAPPEMVEGREYEGPPVDVWSLGVILYFMVTGKHPFEAEDQPALFRKIKAGKYTIKKHVSSDCVDLIAKMLTTDPDKRASLSHVRHHDWFNMGGPSGPFFGGARASPRVSEDSKTSSPTSGPTDGGESLFNKMDFFTRVRSPPSPPMTLTVDRPSPEMRPVTHHEHLPDVREAKDRGLRRLPSAIDRVSRESPVNLGSPGGRAVRGARASLANVESKSGANAARSRLTTPASGASSNSTKGRLAVPKKKIKDGTSNSPVSSPMGSDGRFRRISSKNVFEDKSPKPSLSNGSVNGNFLSTDSPSTRARSKSGMPVEEKVKHRPAGSSIFISTTKSPRDIVREVQKAFSAMHIMFKQLSSLSVRGEAVTSQSRVVLELEITAAGSGGGSESVLRSKKISGEQAEYKELCARVLSEMDL